MSFILQGDPFYVGSDVVMIYSAGQAKLWPSSSCHHSCGENTSVGKVITAGILPGPGILFHGKGGGGKSGTLVLSVLSVQELTLPDVNFRAVNKLQGRPRFNSRLGTPGRFFHTEHTSCAAANFLSFAQLAKRKV